MRRTRRRRGGWPTPRTGTLDLICPAPTAMPGYSFTLTLTGAWEEVPSPRPHHSPHAAAADHALRTALAITADYYATDAVSASARLNTILGRPADLPNAPVRLLWGHVCLTAEPGAAQAAHSHQRHLHELQQRQAQHARRVEEAHTLRDTLMSDPSLALSYWFATAPQTVDTSTLTRLEALFAQAAAYAPQGQWAPLARLLQTFAGNLTDDAKDHLVDTLASLTDRYGRPDIAAAIQGVRALRPEDSAQPPPRTNGSTL
ncbi:hypothetical protein ACWD6Q_34875 [Streptomyces nigra]